MIFRKKLKILLENNLYEDDNVPSGAELWGSEPLTGTEEIITDEPPEETPDKILKVGGVPKGKKPPKFMNVPVIYDLSTEDNYKKALRKRKVINKLYSNVKNSIENYYFKKINKLVSPKNLESEFDPDDPYDKEKGIKYSDAFIKNFRKIYSYKDKGATFEDLLRDLITVDIDKLLQSKNENPSMIELQKYLNELNIPEEKFKENLINDMIIRMSESSKFEELKNTFERSKSSEKTSAKSNVVKKSRQKTEKMLDEFNSLLKSIPDEIKNKYKSDFERLINFSNKIPNKIEKIKKSYQKQKTTGRYESAKERFENLQNRIKQNIDILKMLS